ncbi:MAG: winged helix-turn-helix domain-containing protein [Caulobacteraceae bacterium]
MSTPDGNALANRNQRYIQLISEPGFRLGALYVEPAHRRVIHDDGGDEVLEPRVMQVLVALTRASGAILSRSGLTLSCWDGQVVGEDAITRVISRLRQLSKGLGAESFRIVTVTKVGFRLIEEAASEIEATPPGATAPEVGASKDAGPIVTEAPAARHEEALPAALSALSLRRWTTPVLLVSIVGVLTIGVVLHLRPKSAAVPTLQIAAVDKIDRDGTGLAQDLHNELVAAFGRNSALRLLADDLKIPLPGSLAFRLSSSVRHVGDELRFTYTLERGRPGVVIMSDVVRRPIASVVIAPRQISAQVSHAVRCTLAAASTYKRHLPDGALSNYAGFCTDQGASESGEATTRMTENLRRAVTDTPDFAAGWAALGHVIADRFVYPSALWDAGGRAEALHAADRALAINPENVEAHLSKALLTPWSQYEAREREMLLALRGEDAFGEQHAAYAHFLMTVGRVREAAEQAERGYNLDPTSLEAPTRLVQALYMLRHATEGDALAARTLALWPASAKLPIHQVWAALWTEHYDEGVKVLTTGVYDASARAVGPDSTSGPPIAGPAIAVFRALQSGDKAQRLAAAKSMSDLASSPESIDPFEPVALAVLGQDQEALRAEERVVTQWATSMTFLLFTPAFAQARRAPEFAAMAERLGLTAYWRRTRLLPDFCGEAEPPPICATLKTHASISMLHRR